MPSAAISCVAEENAISQKAAKVSRSQRSVCSERATAANEAPMSSCMARIHQRSVRKRSTMGLHSGLMTQGR